MKYDADGNSVPGKVDPNNLYKCLYIPAATGPSGWMLRSADAGESWQTQAVENDLSNTQGWYAREIAVDATDPKSLFVAYMSPNRSFDGGKTLISGWAPARFVMQAVYDQANQSLIFVDFHAIVIAPSNPDILYFACDQGVYRSPDRGISAVRSNKGLDLMQFYRGTAMSQKDDSFIAGNPQDYGPGFMRYKGGGQWEIVPGYGYEVGYASLDDTNDILYLGQHTNRRMTRWKTRPTRRRSSIRRTPTATSPTSTPSIAARTASTTRPTTRRCSSRRRIRTSSTPRATCCTSRCASPITPTRATTNRAATTTTRQA